MIRVHDFHKMYADFSAVDGLSFEVQAGEILGLVGPNGAGKTTTLRAIAGIIPPSSGELLIGDQDVVKTPQNAKRSLAYVPDDPNLFDALTVWEHLVFIASAYCVPDFTQEGERLLELFELREKRNTIAHELSRGMRQKVAIACAYLHNPSAILFDEPHTGLDPRGIRTMKQSIRERAAAGAAIVISSHLLTLVHDICSHLLILDRGKCRFWGTMESAVGTFDDLKSDATLEEIFFRATETNCDADPGDARTGADPAKNPEPGAADSDSEFSDTPPSSSTEGGSTDGSSADGGSTDGSSADGGSADGGSADGGSADGGSADGGSADGGVLPDEPRH